jgi:hypothetical protein
MNEKCNRRYDWEAIQRFYDGGHTVRECISEFGFANKTWFDAVQRGAVIPRPQALPLEILLVSNKRRGRRNIKQHRSRPKGRSLRELWDLGMAR